MRFTAAQLEAISNTQRDVCVSAGAGSGKTGVLVERYLRILNDASTPSTVDQILVITFTDRAAQEMKARIISRLDTPESRAHRLAIDGAYISTIHSFCARVLRNYPFEAQVPVHFTVLDEPEARILLQQAHQTAFEKAVSCRGPLRDLVDSCLDALPPGLSIPDILSALCGEVGQILHELRSAGRNLDEIWALAAGHEIEGSSNGSQVVDLAISACLEAAQHSLSALKNTEIEAGFVDAVEAYLHRIKSPEGDEGNSRNMLRQVAARLRAMERDSPVGSALLSLQESLASLVSIKRNADAGPHKLPAAMFEYVAEVWTEYHRIKMNSGKLDHEDLQERCVGLLSNHPDIRNRLQSQFRNILVDEFQDTNEMQMRLIDLLHDPNQDSSTKSIQDTSVSCNSLFVVGDPNQSIYAFRNANPELFVQFQLRSLPDARGPIQLVALRENFRSRPEILQFINTLFASGGNHSAAVSVHNIPGGDWLPEDAPCVEALVTRDMPRRDYVAHEAMALASRVRMMVECREIKITAVNHPRCGEPAVYGDIAVLLRSFTDLQTYIDAFAAEGVPATVYGGGRGYYSRPEVHDLINLLDLIDSPFKEDALLAVMRSPIVNASIETLQLLREEADKMPKLTRKDRGPLYLAIAPLVASGSVPTEEATALSNLLSAVEELSRRADHDPPAHILADAISMLDIETAFVCRPYGLRRVMNMRKLVDIALKGNTSTLKELVEHLRSMAEHGEREGDASLVTEDASVVRFMTIHSAKGTEAPVVVVPDLSRELIVPVRSLFACRGSVPVLGTRFNGRPDRNYLAISKLKQERDRSEYLRLLYVALTRAQEYILLGANVGRNRQFNWADFVTGALRIDRITDLPANHSSQDGATIRVDLQTNWLPLSTQDVPRETESARRARVLDDLLAGAD